MNTTSVHIKLEANIKEQAQQTAEELGLSLSAVMKALLKQFIRTKRLVIGIDEDPSDFMIAALKEADEEYKQGKTSPSFNNLEKSFKWLDK